MTDVMTTIPSRLSFRTARLDAVWPTAEGYHEGLRLKPSLLNASGRATGHTSTRHQSGKFDWRPRTELERYIPISIRSPGLRTRPTNLLWLRRHIQREQEHGTLRGYRCSWQQTRASNLAAAKEDLIMDNGSLTTRMQ
ncbi:hypothetical protein BM1_01231 [Bipolaris maydis]|nr:hypothetical protein BM1_01231 [Bipolaris maydis]